MCRVNLNSIFHNPNEKIENNRNKWSYLLSSYEFEMVFNIITLLFYFLLISFKRAISFQISFID